MGGRAVNVVNPSTGELGSVDESKLARARATGARTASDAEVAKYKDGHENLARDIGEGFIAGEIGTARGFGEAFGVPLDPLTVGVAEAFGKGEDARSYLKGLKERHSGMTALSEMGGQAGGFIAGAELLGGGGLATKAPTVAGRIAQAGATGAVRGGLENFVAGSTHDVNEATLGDPSVAGQKLWTRAPKHFAIGLAAGGVFGAGLAGVGEVAAPLLAKAPGALERQASAAIGRDLGAAGEEAVALGGRVREVSGGIPKDASSVADIFAREQAQARGAASAARDATVESTLGRQTTDAWQQSARSESIRKSLLTQSEKAIGELETSHRVAREALSTEQKEATAAFERVAEERAANVRQMKTLAADLDRVKGAELPSPQNIFRTANEAFQAGPSMTPPSEGALKVFNEWAEGFAAKYEKPGSLKFSSLRDAIESLDVAERRHRVMSGTGQDPDVKRAFDALRTASKEEFDRASATTAGMVSEAKHLNAERIRAASPELEAAYKQASEQFDKTAKAAATFEKQSAAEVAQARAQAEQQFRSFEKGASREAKDLGRRQGAEIRQIPKASKATPFDDITNRAKSSARRAGNDGGIGIGTAFGAASMLASGNVAGAAMSALGGLAAGRARSQGNYTAAKVMRFLSEQLAKTDDAIAKGAGRLVRGSGRALAEAGADRAAMEPAKPKREPSYEEVSKRIRMAEVNPQILEMHVRQVAGPIAVDAPQIYHAMLQAAQLEQAFLASKLPPSTVDPRALQPHLAEESLSDSEKYDFMQYVKALRQSPEETLKDVHDGDLTDQQVEAIEFARPAVYAQMKAEVARQIATATEEIPYERAIHIGSLLQEETDTVLDPEFQRDQARMYAKQNEEKRSAKGSMPSGEAKSAMSAQSASERVERGDI